jgi:hypothetical protein
MHRLAVVLVCAGFACDSGEEKENVEPQKAADEKAPATADAKKDDAKVAENAAETPADAEKAAEKAPEPERDPPKPEPLAWASGATFESGPITFFPAKAGEGELPAKPREHASSNARGFSLPHPDPFGWSVDSSSFAYCYFLCAENCGTCFETSFDGEVKTTQTEGCASSDEESPAERKVRRSHTVTPQQWRYGKEVRIVWRVDNAKLKIGADVVGVGKSAWAPSIDYSNNLPENAAPEDLTDAIWPEVILLSPDATKLAVLSRMSVDECEANFRVTYIDVGPLVADAYNKAAFFHHKKSEGDKAATFFAKASEAQTDQWKFPFNMACALAKGGDKTKVEAALARAIELGGDDIKKKAQKDGDLESVRGEDWFAALTK